MKVVSDRRARVCSLPPRAVTPPLPRLNIRYRDSISATIPKRLLLLPLPPCFYLRYLTYSYGLPLLPIRQNASMSIVVLSERLLILRYHYTTTDPTSLLLHTPSLSHCHDSYHFSATKPTHSLLHVYHCYLMQIARCDIVFHFRNTFISISSLHCQRKYPLEFQILFDAHLVLVFKRIRHIVNERKNPFLLG